MGVLMEKKPLRVLLRFKGALGITVLWFVLLTTFSLTPSQRIYSPPIHHHSAVGKPNILLITVDGLSESWLKSGHTPNLTAMEKSAWRFVNAFSMHRSIWRYGIINGIDFNSDGQSPLVESMETLTERLAYEGYQTHGMVSHLAVGRFTNLHRGFDRFRYIPPKMPTEVLRWGLGNERCPASQTGSVYFESISSRGDLSMKWFVYFKMMCDPMRRSPWFGWLHLLPHPDVTERLRLMDRSIGELLRSVSDQTIIVLTASFQYSSGETFNRLPVPLLIWVPNSVPKVIHNNVLLSDVATTLTSLVGLPTPTQWEGGMPCVYLQCTISML